MLCDLCNDRLVSVGDFDGVQQTGQLILLEADIQNRAHDLDHSSFVFGHEFQLLMFRVCGLRAGHDLGDLLGNGGLTGAVELEAQVRDHVFGILGCGIHCAAARGLLRGPAFAEGSVENAAQILGDDGGKDLLPGGLIENATFGTVLRIASSQVRGSSCMVSGVWESIETKLV